MAVCQDVSCCSSLTDRKVLADKRVFLVNEGMAKDEAGRLGVAYTTDSFDDALGEAFAEQGENASIVRVPLTFDEHR